LVDIKQYVQPSGINSQLYFGRATGREDELLYRQTEEQRSDSNKRHLRKLQAARKLNLMVEYDFKRDFLNIKSKN